MAINVSDSLNVTQQKSIDKKYDNDGAGYLSIAAVNAAIPISVRSIGLTVNIQGVEYWYKEGLSNGNLILKTSTSPSWQETINTNNTVNSPSGASNFKVNLGDTNPEITIKTRAEAILDQYSEVLINKDTVSFNNVEGDTNSQIKLEDGKAFVGGDTTTFNGLTYLDDYTANMVDDRNIPDIGKVQDMIDSSISVPNLQEVTNEGNTTNSPLIVGDGFPVKTSYQGGGLYHERIGGNSTSIGFIAPTVAVRSINFPNADGTLPVSFTVNGGSAVQADDSGVVALITSGSGTTNLTYTPSPTQGQVNSDTGTDAVIPLADGTNAGLLTPAEKTKLTNLAANANTTYAPLASPAFTGTPTVPTATVGTNTTQAASTAFVQAAAPVLTREIRNYENLFNKDAAGMVVDNFGLQTNGTIAASVNAAVTGFIEIPPSKDIYILKTWFGTPMEYAFYDATQTFISYATAATTLLPPGGKLATSPSNAKFLRMNIKSITNSNLTANAAGLMVYVGDAPIYTYRAWTDYVADINGRDTYNDSTYVENLVYNTTRNRAQSYTLPVNALPEDSLLDNNTANTTTSLGGWTIKADRNTSATKADGYIQIVKAATLANGGILFANFFKATDIGKQAFIEFEAKLISGDANWRVLANGSAAIKDFVLTTANFVKYRATVTVGTDDFADQRLYFYQNGSAASTIQVKNFKVFFTNPDVNALATSYNPQFNLGALPNFNYKATQLLNGESVILNLGLFGDSWTQGVPSAIRYAQTLSRQLRLKYGNGGGGFYDFSRSNTPDTFMESIDPLDANSTRAGTIVYTDQSSTSKGVNVAHAAFGIGSTLTLNVTTPHTALVIHYYTDPTFGAFRYRVDGGSWTTVNTAVAADHKTIALTGLADTTHVVDFEVEATSPAACIILGVDMQRSTGIRVHKLGNRGLRADQVVAMNATVWQQGLSTLNLDSMSILLGTNDRTTNVVPSDFYSSMDTVITRALTAIPYLDIALIGASNNQDTRTYQMIEYNRQLFSLAVFYTAAYLGLEVLFGSTAEVIAKGTFFDSVHPTITGGNMIASYLFDELLDIDNLALPSTPPVTRTGVSTQSGTGVATSFNIPHGLGVEPSYVSVSELNSATAGVSYLNKNSTNIIVYYSVAPTVGTNNLSFNWLAIK